MEDVCLELVCPQNVETVWPEVGPWIVQAVGPEADSTDVEYIKRAALTGNATIFVATNRKGIEAVLVTEAAFYGGKRTLVLRWLSGTDRANWIAYYHYIEDYAFRSGFDRLEVWGRPGWKRALKDFGFKHEYTVLGKFLTRRVH